MTSGRCEGVKSGEQGGQGQARTWLRFGALRHIIRLDAWRRVAVFLPGAVCCRVKAVLALLDQMAASQVALVGVSPAYWRTVNNGLAARLAPPVYRAKRHAAHRARCAF